MKVVHCDNHPGVTATASFLVRELAAGSRPMLIGPEVPKRVLDLCDDCAEIMRSKLAPKAAS